MNPPLLRALWRGALLIALSVVASASARANDRLPAPLVPSYETARTEVQKYTRYLMRKVWAPLVQRLAVEPLHPADRAAVAAELVDEIVHLALPQAKAITRDVMFGTGATYVRIAMPELRAKAAASMSQLLKAGKPGNVADAIEQASNVSQRALNDRIDQALREDLEGYAQEWVEGGVGLPLGGRPRASTRPLPGDWEPRYQGHARAKAHWFTNWWQRKRNRLSLSHMATTMSREEIDRARHEGPIWKQVSALSQEVWAQNRVRMDFKWGRVNWEMDRRRIRRRMEQDVAQAAWAMTRHVKELLAPDTMKQVGDQLRKRVEQELDKPENKDDAERYPDSRGALQQRLQGLKQELNPLFDNAMKRVELPADMGPELQEQSREHGRRFMHDELEGPLARHIRDEASARSAARRVKQQLPGWVAEGLSRFDPGATKDNVRDFVKRHVLPRAREEVGDALRAAGREDLEWQSAARERAIDEVIQRKGVDAALEQEIEKQTRGRGESR